MRPGPSRTQPARRSGRPARPAYAQHRRCAAIALGLAGLVALPVVAAAADQAAPSAANPAADPAAAIARGAALVASRSQGLCVLCHALPDQPAAHQGTIGPSLAGVGARLSPQQLRGRLLAPQRFNPDTVMPAYGARDATALHRVPAALRDQPLLTPAQLEDVLAWLAAQR